MLGHFSKVLLRTPLQPVSNLFIEALNANNELFFEALFLSSPDYVHELSKLHSKTAEQKEKILLSLSKYWTRSCTRSTPFATFAGCAIVDVKPEKTNLELNLPHEHKKKLRLDMAYVASLTHALYTDDRLMPNLKLYRNSSLYELPGEYRYAEYIISDGVRKFNLQSIEKTDALKAVFNVVANGATIKELSKVIFNACPDTEEHEISEFIASLLESQILVPDLEPPITGGDSLTHVLNVIESIDGNHPIIPVLKHGKNLLDSRENGVQHYRNIRQTFQAVAPSSGKNEVPVQADLFLSLNRRVISESIINTITSQINKLLVLSRNSLSNDLETFKAEFFKRYEFQEVSLVIALDSDVGIGYGKSSENSIGGSIYINDLETNQVSSQHEEKLDRLNLFILQKYVSGLRTHAKEIEITDEDLSDFSRSSVNFIHSKTMAVMGSLLPKENKFDDEDFLFSVSTLGGSSAGNLLGRFAYADKEIEELIGDIIKFEETDDPEVIYAEVVHLPQAKLGNILLRPTLRSYEIPYVGKSGINPDNQLRIDDLMICIRNERIVLKSKRLNRIIIPRLTTAHNFATGNLPIYKFLCDLQAQGQAFPILWDWGILSANEHLPRVVYKNIILKKAEWLVKKTEITDLPTSRKEYLEYFNEFCKKREIPRHVVLVEYDNELLIDFDSIDSILILLQYINRSESVRLTEFHFSENQCIARDTNGNRYAHEIIIPIRQLNYSVPKPVNFKSAEDATVPRTFSIGSDWVYFKIYTGAKSADRILADLISPFIDENLNRLFSKFFFVRYSDEIGKHLRVRFLQGKSEVDDSGRIMKELLNRFKNEISNKTIHKISIDTYSRELERYSPKLIEEAESIFCNDSIAVLKILSLLDTATDAIEIRIFIAIRGIDMLLNDFSMTLDEKHDLSAKISAAFFTEFGGGKDLQTKLNEKYRALQREITKYINPENDHLLEFEEVSKILSDRSDSNRVVVESISNKIINRSEIISLLPDYIHMFINRFFVAQQRKYELLINSLLERFYNSQKSRRSVKRASVDRFSS